MLRGSASVPAQLVDRPVRVPAQRSAARWLLWCRKQWLTLDQRDRRRLGGAQLDVLAGVPDGQLLILRTVAQRVGHLVVDDVDGQPEFVPAQPEPQSGDAIWQVRIEVEESLVVA